MKRRNNGGRMRRLAVCLSMAALSGCVLLGIDGGEGEEDAGTGEADAATGPVIPLDEVHVMGLGDSVTVGYCARPLSQSFFNLLVRNDDQTHPDWAGRDLSSHFGSVTTNNRAISGSTSCDWAGLDLGGIFDADSDTGRPTILIMTLGGNDLIHDYSCWNPQECAAFCSDFSEAEVWAERFKERVIGFLEVAKEKVQGELFIFLANIYDPTDGVGDIENAPVAMPAWPDGIEILTLYNQKLAEVAEATGATFVDMRGAVMGHGIHYNDTSHEHYDADNPTYWYCSNLEDPNNAGYHAIRQIFWEAISGTLRLE